MTRWTEEATDTAVIITARGGSTRLANKALSQCAGYPLIAWTVEAAIRAEVGPVWCSSDSQAILDTAALFGALPRLRAAELASDTAQREVAINELLKAWGPEAPDRLVMLSPDFPLRQAHRIREAVEMLGQWDSVIAVVDGKHLPFAWRDGVPLYDPNERPRSQDCNVVLETGAIYAFRLGAYYGHSVICGNTGFLRMEQWESVDVEDNWTSELADWIVMRQLLRREPRVHLPQIRKPR